MDADQVVFILHPNASTRENLEQLVQRVGYSPRSCASIDELLACYDQKQFGCLLLAAVLSGVSGIDVQQRLLDQGCALPCIFVVDYPDVSSAVAAMKNGAIDYLELPLRPQELLTSIHRALQLSRVFRTATTRWQELQQRLSRLTAGEHRVFELVAAGKQKKAIATELGLSTRTIEIRRAKIMRKLHVTSLSDLIKISLVLKCISATSQLNLPSVYVPGQMARHWAGMYFLLG